MKTSRAFLALAFFLLIFPLASGSQIKKEEVVVDLNSPSEVRVNITYGELTQEKLSYIVPYSMSNVRASIKGRSLECTTQNVEIGTELLCETDEKRNFSVYIRYNTNDMVSRRGELSEFSYSRNILEPIQSYELKAILPEGSGIYESSREEFKSIDPEPVSIGSTGRRIHVVWKDQDMNLGGVLRFNLYFERLRFFEHLPYLELIVIAGAVVIGISVAYFYFRSGKKTISSVLPVLKEGEREVLKIIIEKGEECKQKEIVESVDYSKAKVSRIIKDLDERNLIEKKKVGRTNVIQLSKDIGEADI